MSSRVTRRYVQGFLGVLDAARIDAVEAALERFDALLRTSPPVTAVLYHPGISRTKKQALVSALAADAPPELVRFLLYMISKKREHMLKGLCVEFKNAADGLRGIVRGRVCCASALRDAQQQRLTASLSAALGKEVKLETRTDAGLLAGMQVFVGSHVIDGSVKSRLARLRKHLLEETTQLKPVA
ncbi:MAG: ATP synthase F1 subunit delta [Deltaproteobacteria bacterium]|nr:ATP synthase F1 subunit delta [Deltaproteobacteria bacterium]